MSNPEQLLSSPGKKRSRISKVEQYDDFDFSIVRRIIEKFYLELKQVPTLRKLLRQLRTEINFPFSRETLRRLLKSNGFCWRKCQNKRKILVEKPNILHWRYKYIHTIRKYRAEDRNIIYIDETWVNNDLTVKNCWQSAEVFGVSSSISSTGRFIVVHAGSSRGFVENAALIFKAGQSSGDYHGQMNRDNFTKWLTEKLLPNIPPNSIIVLDNAPYHSVQEDKVPTKSSLKKDMVAWLSKKGITHDPTARKFALFELVQLHKPPGDQKNYAIDTIIKNQGHIPLRTPPYMCELNPIELAWAQIKRYIRDHNTSGDLSIAKLKEVLDIAIASVTPADWEKFCNHVLKIEQKFWETDYMMEQIEPIIINLGHDSETDDSDSDSDGDMNSDKENYEEL